MNEEAGIKTSENLRLWNTQQLWTESWERSNDDDLETSTEARESETWEVCQGKRIDNFQLLLTALLSVVQQRSLVFCVSLKFICKLKV